LFRFLPSVDAALNWIDKKEIFAGVPRTLLREQINIFFDVCREEIINGIIDDEKKLNLEALAPRMICHLKASTRPHFRRVLNATGVVVHTNLGRSLLSESASRAVYEACSRYSNLEFDLSKGERGSRYSHVEKILCDITGAESALVVNNNAAAVMIVLDTLASGKEVVVSRGQLVEIGGSFRIPDVMEKSGAVLHEVGATNRTHLYDYQRAVNENTALLMKVHTSNFRVIGFTKEVSGGELRNLGLEYGLPVYEDLGSGNLTNFDGLGLLREPTVQEIIAEGVDIVSFSGDKVLGGPQAGIIVGRKEYLDRIKRNPMNRALRIDKMTLAALEATLRLYLDPRAAEKDIPTLRMIKEAPASLQERAKHLLIILKKVLGDSVELSTLNGVSRVGGGAFPEQDLSTTLVCVKPLNSIHVDDLRDRLLSVDPPLVGRIEDGLFCLDPRTLAECEYKVVANSIKQALRL
jgi:L-seryl-tRNA(Ser) seleniumtransferase